MHNFSDEQVEAAAVASINSHRSRAGLPTLATLDGVPNADEWRGDARAALEAATRAAQGAAPVLPSSTVDEGGPYKATIMHTSRQAGKTSHLVEQLLEQGKERGIEVTIVPPQVDEDALAEVLCREMDGETYEGEPCAACKSQAHAVAEWLAGKEKSDAAVH